MENRILWTKVDFKKKFENLIPRNVVGEEGWKDSRHNYLLRPIEVTMKVTTRLHSVEVNIDWSKVDIFFTDNMYGNRILAQQPLSLIPTRKRCVASFC